MSDKQEILRLFRETSMYYKEIAEATGFSKKVVLTTIHKAFSKDEIAERTRKSWSRAKTEGNNAQRGCQGVDCAHWKGEEVEDGKGYVMVIKPTWYTGRKGSKYVFKHQVVLCEALGLAEMPKGFVVHHVDGDKRNNNLNNLALMTAGAHTKLHWNSTLDE